jgi:hypothetical protein
MNFNKVFVNLFQFNRTNWKAVVLCFLAASVFWLFNAFNKSYATTVHFPLRFDYDQEKYVPVAVLPTGIYLNVSGNGWDLFRKTLGFRLPELIIPLEKPTEVKKIVGSTLTSVFVNQLGELQINYILTDTLIIQLEEKDSHSYRLIPDLTNSTFRKGYGRISPIVILPDSVILEGPKSLLHAMADPIVLYIKVRDLDESFSEELELVVDNNGLLKRNPPVASVMFEVGPVEVVETKILVRVAQMPATVKSSYIDSVNLVVQIPKAQSNDFHLSQSAISALLDLENRTKGTYSILPQIIGLPEYAEIISLDSLVVRFF